jgi:hypothetical protein
MINLLSEGRSQILTKLKDNFFHHTTRAGACATNFFTLVNDSLRQ